MALKRAWGVESSYDSCFSFCPDLLIPTLFSAAIPSASSILNSPAAAQLSLVPACSTSCHFTPVPPGQGLPDGLSCVQALMLLVITLVSVQGRPDPDLRFLEMKIQHTHLSRKLFAGCNSHLQTLAFGCLYHCVTSDPGQPQRAAFFWW